MSNNAHGWMGTAGLAPLLWSTVQVKGDETQIPLLEQREQQVCSNQVLKLTSSITGHSAVGTGWLLNHPYLALHTSERIRPPRGPSIPFLLLLLCSSPGQSVKPREFPGSPVLRTLSFHN